MNKNGLFAFYGTLRNGMENYRVYKEGMRFIVSVRLGGFSMYSVGEYPYIVRSGDAQKIITVELFQVTDPVTAHAIHTMEIEAGYYYDEIVHDGDPYGIYLFPSARPGDVEILSGDWVGYVGQIGF